LIEDGRLSLEELPFRAGEAVEVIVLPASNAGTQSGKRPLHGMVLHYEDPTEPVAAEEWDALR
jgi:hypothetical protein